jgi:DnaJ family protein C protein 28
MTPPTPPQPADHPRDDRSADDQHARLPGRARRRVWTDIVEEQIREAQERGAFDNLPGAGKPLVIDENPAAGEKALAYSLLKVNRLAPREIALGQEVEGELARAEALLVALRRRRDDLARRRVPAFASERRAYNVARARTEARYAEALQTARGMVLSLNITAPTALHRPLVDVAARLAAFRADFPPLAE